ncbi:MAG TPA: DUF4186 domain-containing protein [Methylophilaceae bacterium]|nr:DUF4186 domain-containing protein [Methylophilaceae bacterium]
MNGQIKPMRRLDELFPALQKSAFRRSFHLRGKDLAYLQQKGLPTVMTHAGDFIAKRLKPADIPNDGKQTPFRGHPVFVAQHATACCCRQCLEKWHGIPSGHLLSAEEEAHILQVIERWLREELEVAQKRLL